MIEQDEIISMTVSLSKEDKQEIIRKSQALKLPIQRLFLLVGKNISLDKDSIKKIQSHTEQRSDSKEKKKQIDSFIALRMTLSDRDDLRAKAEHLKMSLSSFLVTVVLNAKIDIKFATSEKE